MNYFDKDIIDEYINLYTARGERIERHPEVLKAYINDCKEIVSVRSSAKWKPSPRDAMKYCPWKKEIMIK